MVRGTASEMGSIFYFIPMGRMGGGFADFDPRIPCTDYGVASRHANIDGCRYFDADSGDVYGDFMRRNLRTVRE